MAEDAHDWKQVDDVLKTEGNILEIGSFVSRSGEKVTISPEYADFLFDTIESKLPFVVLHEDGYNEEVGYATKFERNSTGIAHKGLVFTNDKLKNAIAMGYSISPEIELFKDASGNVIGGKIEKLAFVPNPAMKQTSVNIARFAFSAPEVTSMPDEGTTTNTQTNTTTEQTVNIQGKQVPVSTFSEPQNTQPAPTFDPNAFAQNIATSIAEGLATKIGTQLESIQQQIDALKTNTVDPIKTAQSPITQTDSGVETKAGETATLTDPPANIPTELFEQFAKLQQENQAYKSQIESSEKTAYTNKLAELRNLKVDNPEKLVSHLSDYKSKIATLDAFKVQLVKSTPMNSPAGASPMSAEGGNQSRPGSPTILNLADSLRIDLSTEEAERLSKRMKLPVQ